jgi:hypothetical protein
MNQLVDVMFEIEDMQKHPLLNQTIIRPTLLNKTKLTLHQLELDSFLIQIVLVETSIQLN